MDYLAYLSYIIFLLLACQDQGCAYKTTLKKLQIVFRHGFRAPDDMAWGKREDCFADEPMKLLTKLGRSQMSYLGYFLRMRYGHFLGSNPNETKMIYSNYSRNFESAQLVFDGMFSEYSHEGINFTMMDPRADGPLNTDDNYYNETFAQMLNEKSYQGLMEYLTKLNKTFFPIDELYKLYFVQDQVDCEVANDCDLPKWLTRRTVKELEDFNNAYYRGFIECKNEKIIRDNSDALLQEIIKSFNRRNPDPYKVFLYSAHDTNIAPLLTRISMFNGLPVPFGAFVVFELHRRKKRDYVEVYYYNSTNYLRRLRLKHPNLPFRMPYRKFADLVNRKYSCY